LLLFGTTGCVAQTARQATLVQYACASGVEFSASLRNAAVILHVQSRAYRLGRRGGSLERYGSDSVAFVRDADTAVLIGAEGGPYDGCVEVR
jgi:hypothetical protein